jgi:hypothetical protein
MCQRSKKIQKNAQRGGFFTSRLPALLIIKGFP